MKRSRVWQACPSTLAMVVSGRHACSHSSRLTKPLRPLSTELSSSSYVSGCWPMQVKTWLMGLVSGKCLFAGASAPQDTIEMAED